MDFVHREQEGVPPFPFLDGRLSISDRPLVYGVRKRLLNPLLPNTESTDTNHRYTHCKANSTANPFPSRTDNSPPLSVWDMFSELFSPHPARLLFLQQSQTSLPWASIPSDLLKLIIFTRAARRFQSPLPGSWIWMVLKIPSNPDCSGVLWDQEPKTQTPTETLNPAQPIKTPSWNCSYFRKSVTCPIWQEWKAEGWAGKNKGEIFVSLWLKDFCTYSKT